MRIIPVISSRLSSAALALTLPIALALGACGSSAGSSGSTLTVVASFYPMQYVAARIVGDQGSVSSLTKPGAEPHDLELSPRDVAEIGDASLVFYVKGFQPAVDDAVAQQAGDHALDAAGPADLSLRFTPIEEGQPATGEAGSVDPHFWLDPHRLAAVADALAERLGSMDPAHRQDYATRAAALHRDLDALDAELRAGLGSCTDRTIVTSHNAFGYLAQRYGLSQLGITGLTPDAEPSPAQLASVSTFVRQHKVSTIYYETLVSPRIAETVARETGARTAVLDPLEGLTDQSRGTDYLQVMRSNLQSLRAGQGCS